MSEIQEINIKPCRVCGSTTNKFSPNRRKCTKCRSKRNNELLNDRNFYKEYYVKNRDVLLMKSHMNYLKKCLENSD